MISLTPIFLLACELPYPYASMGISLCMIVKNEQDWVAGAVESVRSIVNEVIIVDTGSTDHTLERLQAFGPQVIHFTWNDSFADARNASLLRASEKWILVLDADERIAAKDLPHVLEATRSGAADAYHLVQRNYVFGNQVFGWSPNVADHAEGKQYPGYVDNPLIRLFRNSSDLRFHGAVHEIIDPTRTPKNFKFASIPAVIHHYGKVRDQEYVVAKQRKYLALGLKKIEEDPGNAKAYFDLGIQYQELNRHAEACACFDQTFEMTKQSVALLYWAISEKHLRNYTSAGSLLKRALKHGLDTFDVHLELGNVYLALNDFNGALAEYNACLMIKPTNPVVTFNRGLAFRKMNNLAGAEKAYRCALELDPLFKEPAMELAVLFGDSQRYNEAIDLLKPVAARNPESRDVRLMLAKTYIQSNQPDAALGLLNTAIATDAVAQCLLGAAHLQKNNLDEAQSHLEAALKGDRTLVDARINLAQVFLRKGDHARAARYAQSAGMSGANASPTGRSHQEMK